MLARQLRALEYLRSYQTDGKSLADFVADAHNATGISTGFVYNNAHLINADPVLKEKIEALRSNNKRVHGRPLLRKSNSKINLTSEYPLADDHFIHLFSTLAEKVIARENEESEYTQQCAQDLAAFFKATEKCKENPTDWEQRSQTTEALVKLIRQIGR